MLEVTSLVHSYDQKSEIKYPDWKVEKGRHSAILGSSGSGKTTFLHILGGLLKPTEGMVGIGGTNISSMSQSALDRFRGANIGIVFQKPHLISSLTVLDNLILAQYLGMKKTDKKQAKEIMTQLGINELSGRKVHQISQGQAQRVSIARALLNRPKLLLADEPTASLDDENCEKVIRLLKDQAELCESTLLVATHDQRVKRELENTLAL